MRTFRPPRPVDLRRTLAPLGHGGVNMRFGPDGVWRATRTPDGPATMRFSRCGDDVTVEAWGPGALRALDAAPRLVGGDDDDSGFRPRDPLVAGLARRFASLRICRSDAVFEALVPSILEQKVTGYSARQSYRALARRHGEPAPGPVRLTLPPAATTLGSLPYFAFHPLGVERKRADTVRRAAQVAPRLEETTAMTMPAAYRRLQAVAGIGLWTAAEVAAVALGDADAVPVGDYHVPGMVGWALAGDRGADDARMLELLEPYRGQRGRVIRLLAAGGLHAPRHGPRTTSRDFSRQ